MWELSKKWWIISVILFLPPVFLIVGGLISPPESSREIPFIEQPVFGGIMWLVMLIGMHVCMFAFLTHQKKKAEYFALNGLKASALILDAQETGTYINNCPKVEFKLQISVPGREQYEVIHKQCISHLSLAQFQQGLVKDVLVDPKNPKKIMFVE